jgi:hypothetical protein
MSQIVLIFKQFALAENLMSFKVKVIDIHFQIVVVIISIILQMLPAGIEHLGVGRPGLRSHSDSRSSSTGGTW